MEADSLLITKHDIKRLRPTAELDNERIEPYILNAQTFDLRAVLGDPLYLHMLKNFDVVDSTMYAKYQDLLCGAEYQKADGLDYRFDGIKDLLVYYTLARFLPEHPIHITRMGLVYKTGDQSTPVTSADINKAVNILKSNAETILLRMYEFLDVKKADYGLWKRSTITSVRKSGFRISKL